MYTYKCNIDTKTVIVIPRQTELKEMRVRGHNYDNTKSTNAMYATQVTCTCMDVHMHTLAIIKIFRHVYQKKKICCFKFIIRSRHSF